MNKVSFVMGKEACYFYQEAKLFMTIRFAQKVKDKTKKSICKGICRTINGIEIKSEEE